LFALLAEFNGKRDTLRAAYHEEIKQITGNE
jgi:hypothetical protein